MEIKEKTEEDIMKDILFAEQRRIWIEYFENMKEVDPKEWDRRNF